MLSGLTDTDEPAAVNNQLIPELILAEYREGVCQDGLAIRGSRLFSGAEATLICCVDKRPWCAMVLTKFYHQSQITALSLPQSCGVSWVWYVSKVWHIVWWIPAQNKYGCSETTWILTKHIGSTRWMRLHIELLHCNAQRQDESVVDADVPATTLRKMTQPLANRSCREWHTWWLNGIWWYHKSGYSLSSC